MNKSELIQCLRDPSKLKPEQLAELDKLIHQYPAFLSARLIMAKASKELKHTKAKKFIASAAIYSTDRVLLKKYLSGDLFFLTKPSETAQPTRRQKAAFAAKVESKSSGDQPEKQKPSEVKNRKESAPSSKKKTPKSSPEADKKQEKVIPPGKDKKTDDKIHVDSGRSQPSVPDLPSGSLDAILESLERDMENLKASREKFLEVQEKISEEDPKAPLKTSEVTSEKEATEKPEVNASPETSEETSPLEVRNTVEENETAEEYSPEAGIEVTPAPDKQKAISDITKQVLEAARIAKEEVAKEDALADNADEETQPELQKTQESASIEEQEEASDKKIDQTVAEQIQEEDTKEEKVETKSFFDENSPSAAEAKEAKAPEKIPVEEKPAVKESSNKGKKEVAKKAKPKKDSKEEDPSERAERAFQEPRFSRFSTRSYLRPPEEIDMSGFLDDDENEKTEGASKTLPQEPSSSELEETKPRTSTDSDASSTKIEKDLEETAKSNENLSKTDLGESEATSIPRKESEESDKKSAEADKQVELEKKYNLPDLSKAKAVPRKSKPRKKKIAAETNPKTENTKSSVKRDNATTEETKKEQGANQNSDDSNSVVTEKIDPKEAAKGSGIKKKDPKDLIEDFIQKSPTIKYKRTEDASPEDLAQESAAWDPNLASEYLAEIYLNQGNKKRAKEIYEALSLKYPEKKSYFADLISKIK